MKNRGILLGAAVVLAAAAFYAADVKLPPPYATPSVNNGPRVIPQPAGAQLHVPAGLSVSVYPGHVEGPPTTRPDSRRAGSGGAAGHAAPSFCRAPPPRHIGAPPPPAGGARGCAGGGPRSCPRRRRLRS